MAKICPVTDEPVLYVSCQECEDRAACEKGEIKPVFALLVVGSRSITDYGFVKEKLDNLIRPIRDKYRFQVVSGGANGVDKLAERYAEENGFEMHVMLAEWNKHGKRAGFIRNNAMHEYISGFAHRGCVAFWDGKSRGTLHSRELAKKYGTQIRFIRRSMIKPYAETYAETCRPYQG